MSEDYNESRDSGLLYVRPAHAGTQIVISVDGETRDIAALLLMVGRHMECGCCSPAFRGQSVRMDLSMDNAQVIITEAK